MSIRNKDDFDYIVKRGAKYVFGHLKDFSPRKQKQPTSVG